MDVLGVVYTSEIFLKLEQRNEKHARWATSKFSTPPLQDVPWQLMSKRWKPNRIFPNLKIKRIKEMMRGHKW
jgi:hypothetical protein